MDQYRELLKKYIKHVGEEEGTWFIPGYSTDWTPEELDILKEIEKELISEQPPARTLEDLKRSPEWMDQMKVKLLEEFESAKYIKIEK